MSGDSATGQVLTLNDGRTVRYEVYGDAVGAPALWLHGGGSSRLEAALLDSAAGRHRVRLIAPDRPGVGGSDPHPGRTVAGYADDVAQILDQLDIEQASVGGLSNGGMYAMAVASRLPDRIRCVIPVNPAVPVADPAARATLRRTSRLAYAAVERNPQRMVRAVQHHDSPGLLMRMWNRFANPDAALLADPERAAMLTALRTAAGCQPASGGLEQELSLAVVPWGFAHRVVRPPVFLVSGEKDSGRDYARVWATELPHGTLVTTPGGHMNLFSPEVADAVARLLADRPTEAEA